jgi:hypothetical protein
MDSKADIVNLFLESYCYYFFHFLMLDSCARTVIRMKFRLVQITLNNISFGKPLMRAVSNPYDYQITLVSSSTYLNLFLVASSPLCDSILVEIKCINVRRNTIVLIPLIH